MKNKEEPSIGLTRGNPSTPAGRQIPGVLVQRELEIGQWFET
jgi:hypothetical protein